jgi:hypothetical protein
MKNTQPADALTASHLVRQYKNGPGLAILLLMFANPGRAVGRDELARASGWSAKPITNALHTLAADGLIQCHGRYNGWLLTTTARQLLLGETERENLHLPAPVVGAWLLDEPEEQEPEDTTTTTSERETFPLPEPWPAVLWYLQAHTGAGPKAARHAIRAAYRRGADPADLYTMIDDWRAYCETPAGATIKYRGALIADRIEQNIPAPQWNDTSNDNDGPRGSDFLTDPYAHLLHH